MKVRQTALPEVLLIEPDVFRDARGSFQELYRKERYTQAGIACDFVQDNLSTSQRHVLRGLHLQHPSAQDKLVFVIEGAVFDVAVDVRTGSPTFGEWAGEILDADHRRQLFIPRGFAHGFCVLSETCTFAYKCSDVYDPAAEVTIAWNDPQVGIRWPVDEPVLSERDRAAPRLADLDPGRLPRFGA
ncbi:MAG: dTDP-4-dehydrorhamnose 3,5-epimerase [Alphaproteobacteria bacterium]